ncbi:hypothetical protein [Ornithinimicrobium flavum]|uniref:hypothetical protein n=1 Tax=Ornithinimicrobium flavum TaxID=1288636 RepID=UPI00106FF202|nr:hypothetical protein [Ornithinimicrobium flavum]
MAARPRLQDRLFTALTTLGALVVLVVGLSRGNTKVAVFGALFFLGYGVLHSVTRRLTPAARLVTGSEADHAERMAQFRATRLAGQVALVIAAVGVVLELTVQWEPGLWVAGTALLVMAAFVAGLWIFSRGPARERDRRAHGDASRITGTSRPAG